MSEPQSFEQPGIPETKEKTEKTEKPKFRRQTQPADSHPDQWVFYVLPGTDRNA
jgi:hypothetical protein